MKYIAILFTLMLPHVEPMEQRFEYEDKAACENFISHTREAWETASSDFRYQLECLEDEKP